MRQTQRVCGGDVLAGVPHRRRGSERDQIENEDQCCGDGGSAIRWPVVEILAPDWDRRHQLMAELTLASEHHREVVFVGGFDYFLIPHRATGLHDCRHTRDRKSTRLNSSHSLISYAVFCLKKKKHDL